MKRIIILLCVMSVCTLSYAKRVAKFMTQLKQGMTTEQVINIMGQPESVSTIDGCTYYNYLDQRMDPIVLYVHETWYYVRFINGYVDSFGQKGDFNSTKEPKQTIDINVNTTSTPPANPNNTSNEEDEVTRLKKLKSLLDAELITQEEYDNKKADILKSL